MESAIILTAVFFAVTIPLYLCTLSATAYRDGVKQGNREDELIAELKKRDKALTYSAREVATLRLDLAVANQEALDKILIEVKPDEEIAELYFDAVDLKQTIDGYDADNYPDDMRLRDIPKCQEDLDAMTTLGDLVDNILHIAEKLDARCPKERD
jgi:hypothetical protein